LFFHLRKLKLTYNLRVNYLDALAKAASTFRSQLSMKMRTGLLLDGQAVEGMRAGTRTRTMTRTKGAAKHHQASATCNYNMSVRLVTGKLNAEIYLVR